MANFSARTNAGNIPIKKQISRARNLRDRNTLLSFPAPQHVETDQPSHCSQSNRLRVQSILRGSHPQSSDFSVAIISNYNFHRTIFHLTTDEIDIVAVLLTVPRLALALERAVMGNGGSPNFLHFFGRESLFHGQIG